LVSRGRVGERGLGIPVLVGQVEKSRKGIAGPKEWDRYGVIQGRLRTDRWRWMERSAVRSGEGGILGHEWHPGSSVEN
jgi:hypothetical protein